MDRVKIFLIMLSCLSTQLNAKQLSFIKQVEQESVNFSYQWQDQAKQTQTLAFTLDKTNLFDHFRNFRRYNASHSQRYVEQHLKRALSESPIEDVQILFHHNGEQMQIEIKGQKQAQVDQAQTTIAQLQQQLFEQHLLESFYTQFTNYDQNLAIKPDHIRIAEQSVDDLKVLKAIILEKVSIQNIRKVTNYVLGFIQSIPYATLESRTTSSGAGFNPPLKTLWENQGDCDSKVTLTAAIFRALMPRIKMLMVFIDNHALIALNIPAKDDELTINVDGFDYVLAEPTGPAMYQLGELSQDSEQAISNGHYFTEKFHSD